jgi:hypothetical protein
MTLVNRDMVVGIARDLARLFDDLGNEIEVTTDPATKAILKGAEDLVQAAGQILDIVINEEA